MCSFRVCMFVILFRLSVVSCLCLSGQQWCALSSTSSATRRLNTWPAQTWLTVDSTGSWISAGTLFPSGRWIDARGTEHFLSGTQKIFLPPRLLFLLENIQEVYYCNLQETTSMELLTFCLMSGWWDWEQTKSENAQRSCASTAAGIRLDLSGFHLRPWWRPQWVIIGSWLSKVFLLWSIGPLLSTSCEEMWMSAEDCLVLPSNPRVSILPTLDHPLLCLSPNLDIVRSLLSDHFQLP